jgi:hypothetical protein
MDWTSNSMIAVYIVLGFAAAAVATWLVMRRTIRTRLRTQREVRDDPDIHDWLVVFDWSRKILYVPTLAASVVAAVLMLLHENGVIGGETTPRLIGGLWFLVFLLNFIVEEFDVNVKVVLIGALCVLALFLWLHLLGWVGAFVRLLLGLDIRIGPVAYLAVTLLGVIAIAVAWIKGLFYYAVFTPNFMNIQWGPTESGDHIAREDFNTHIDTSDILERLLGFGRILVIFKDQKHPPLTFLVWRIGKRSKKLEAVRGKFAIDMNSQLTARDIPKTK